MEKFVSRGFKGRPHEAKRPDRLPPGQYQTDHFPVLSAGPTPRTDLNQWSLTIDGEVERVRRWTWSEFIRLPGEKIKTDIHCVTKWSKFDTVWKGVAVEALLAEAAPRGKYLIADGDCGYTTNMPLEDVIAGKSWIVYSYDNQPLSAPHGGPARLLVPHLYFGKARNGFAASKSSAKIRPDSGNRTAIICPAIRGVSSATQAIAA